MKLKRWLRRLLFTGIALVLLIVIAILVLPHVVSGAWGRERIETLLSDALETPVRLGAVDFGWTTGLEVDGLVIGEDEATGLRVRRLTARPDLLSLLGDEIRVRRIEIEGVDLEVVRERDGRLRLVGWPEPSPRSREEERDEPAEMPRLSGVIAIRDADVTFRDEATGAETTVADVAADVTFEPGANSLPVTVTSADLRFTGDVDLFVENRLREEPGVCGELELSDLRLESYAGLLPLLEGLDRLDGRISGTVRVRLPGPHGVEADLDLTLDRLHAAGSALSKTVSVPEPVRLTGRVELDALGPRVKDLSISCGGVDLSMRAGSIRDGNRIDAHVTVAATSSAIRTLLPDRLPEGADGSAILEATISGTRGELTATFVARASDLAVDGAPADLARPPVEASGRVTWSRADGLVGIEATATRGGLSLEGHGEFGEGLSPIASATIRGEVSEDELRPWIGAENLARTGTGPLALQGRVQLRRAGVEWIIDVLGANEGPTFTVTRGGRTLAARWLVRSQGERWAASGVASLVDPDGAALLEGVPEFGAHWRMEGEIRGTRDLASLTTTNLEIRLGDARLTVDDADVRQARSGNHRGRITAHFSSRLGFRRASTVVLDGQVEGRVQVVLEGPRVRIASETRATDLVVVAPGRFEIREPSAALSSVILVEPGGRLDLVGATLETSRLRASFEGRIADLFGSPEGDGRILARGGLEAFHPFLASRDARVPTGSFEGAFRAVIRPDDIGVSGRVSARPLVVPGIFSSRRSETAVDLTWLRDAGSVVVRRLRVDLDGSSPRGIQAEAAGRLLLSGPRPRFVGKVEASGDLSRIPPSVLPEGMTLGGHGSLEARLESDGSGSVASRLGPFRIRRRTGPPLVDEPDLKLSGEFSWPGDRDRPIVEHARLEAPWGSVTLDGPLAVGEHGRARVGLDVDLPAFVKSHRTLFPEGSEARGRAAGSIEVEGRLDALRDVVAEGPVTVERLTIPGYDFENCELDLRLADGIVEIRGAEARLNGGATSLTGTIDLTEDDPVFVGRFATEGLSLAGTMEPIARYVSPLFALASDLSGKAMVSGEFESRGLDRTAWIGALDADIDLRIDEGAVGGSPVIQSLMTLLRRGRDEPALRFDDIHADIRIAEGRLVTEDLRLRSKDIDIRFRGATGLLDRSIRYAVRVKVPGRKKDLPPLLRALDPEGYIPFRLGGTLTSPSLLPPDVQDVGENLLEGLLKDLLGGKRKKKDRKKRKDRDDD